MLYAYYTNDDGPCGPALKVRRNNDRLITTYDDFLNFIDQWQRIDPNGTWDIDAVRTDGDYLVYDDEGIETLFPKVGDDAYAIDPTDLSLTVREQPLTEAPLQTKTPTPQPGLHGIDLQHNAKIFSTSDYAPHALANEVLTYFSAHPQQLPKRGDQYLIEVVGNTYVVFQRDHVGRWTLLPVIHTPDGLQFSADYPGVVLTPDAFEADRTHRKVSQLLNEVFIRANHLATL